MSSRTFAYLFERFPSFVQTFCYREVREMVRQGMEPRIFSIREPEDAPEHAEKLDLPITYLPPEKELRAEIDRRALPRKVKGAVKKERSRADSQRVFEAAWLAPILGVRHVHAHFGGMAARTAWWLKRLYGITYSFTGHANDIFCENDFPVTNAMLVRDATFVVTETDYARRWMEQKHPSSAGKIHRVFNGIDVDALPARAARAEPPLILSVGRYVEKKGFGDLIESCRLLRERGRAFTCQIVGGGPLAETLRAQIEQLGLGEQVHLLGPRSQSEVMQLLARAKVFVLASVPEAGGGSDNLPTVIAEAMAAGVPCVSTTVAGVPEMIASGESGLLVPPREPAQLADAIDRLLGDEALAQKLGEEGRKTARAKFAITNTVAALKHLLIERAHVPVPEAARAFEPGLRATWQSRWRSWLPGL